MTNSFRLPGSRLQASGLEGQGCNGWGILGLGMSRRKAVALSFIQGETIRDVPA